MVIVLSLCICTTSVRIQTLCFRMFFFCFKQKTAYEMRISDWSSDVCSSDLQMLLDPRFPAMRFLGVEPDIPIFAEQLIEAGRLEPLAIARAQQDRKSVV